MAASDYYQQVYTAFIGYLGRPPTQDALDLYGQLIDDAGGDTTVLTDDLYNSAEGQAIYSGLTTEEAVNQVFQFLFGRNATSDYWVNEVDAGNIAVSELAYTVGQSALVSMEEDGQILQAKIDSSELWAASLDTEEEKEAYQTDDGKQIGRDFLKSVDSSTPATQDEVDNYINQLNTGDSFTLTTAVETVIGTVSNDTIDGTTADSIKGDTIADPSTIDNDQANLVITQNITGTDAPSITNIENIALDFNGFGLTFDGSGISNGEMTVSTSKDLNTQATVTGVGNKGLNFAVGSNIQTLTLQGTSSGSDATTVKLAGGTLNLNAGTTTALETLNLMSNGSANTVKLDTNATTNTMALTGDQTLVIETDLDDFDGDTITNDIVTTAAAAGAAQAAEAGAVTIKTSEDMDSNSDLRNVDVMDWDISNSMGGSELTVMAGTHNFALNNANASNATYKANGTATTDVANFTANKTMSGAFKTNGFETVNITDGTTTAQSLTSADFSTSGAVSLSGPNNFTFATNVTAKSIDGSGLTGTAQLSVTDANLANNGFLTGTANNDTLEVKSIAGATNSTTDRVTINAGDGNNTVNVAATTSTFDIAMNAGSGNDTLTGGAGDDTIIGGAGNDQINAHTGSNFIFGEAGDDLLTLGGGTDNANMGDGNDSVIAGSNLTNADTIAGGSGTDAMSYTTTAATDLDNVSGFEAIDLKITAAATVTTKDTLVDSGGTLKFTHKIGASALNFDGSAETDGKFEVTIGVDAADTIKTGAGADKIVIGSAVATNGDMGAATFTGGKGGDTVDLSGVTASSGLDAAKMIQAKGDSLIVTTVSTTTSVQNSDILKFGATGAAEGFDIDTGNANIETVALSADGSVPGTLANNASYMITGTYDSTLGTFTAAAAGGVSDALFVYDSDASSATQFETVVIVGSKMGGIDDAEMTAGVLTIDVAV